jgi:hypothetical protein
LALVGEFPVTGRNSTDSVLTSSHVAPERLSAAPINHGDGRNVRPFWANGWQSWATRAGSANFPRSVLRNRTSARTRLAEKRLQSRDAAGATQWY